MKMNYGGDFFCVWCAPVDDDDQPTTTPKTKNKIWKKGTDGP